MRRKLAFYICPSLRDEVHALQSGNTKVVLENGRLLDRLQERPSANALLARLAWYYVINDCEDDDMDDVLEVPIRDLGEAFDICYSFGVEPAP